MMNILDQWLIPQWRKAHKMLSTWVFSALLIWLTLPPEQQADLIGWTGLIHPENVPKALLLIGMVVRFIQQPSITPVAPITDPQKGDQ